MFIKEKYPANWFTTIRPAALKKSNYKCATCGVVNHVRGYRLPDGVFVECDEHMMRWAIEHQIKIIRIVLTVSHTNHDTLDNRLSNLKPLCQRCHLIKDKDFHSINRKARVSQSLPPPFSSLLLP